MLFILALLAGIIIGKQPVRHFLQERQFIRQHCPPSPLHLASFQGRLDQVKSLLLTMDVNTKSNATRSTPLHEACTAGKIKVVQYLIETAGAFVESPDQHGDRPLHRASARGKLRVVRYLVQEMHVDMRASNKNDETPLHQAAWNKQYQVLKYLVRQGGTEVVNTRNFMGWTLLHEASSQGNVRVMRILLQNYCNSNSNNKTNTTAVLTATNKAGETALHLASRNGHVAAVLLLLRKGANVHATCNFKSTPLHKASAKGKLNVAKVLVKAGAFVNASSSGSWSWTPLHEACRNGHYAVAKFLVQKGADVTMVAEDGRTPLDCAKESGTTDATALVNFLQAELAKKKMQD